MANSIFMKAEEVQEFLGVSRTESYRIIKRLNEELKANGYGNRAVQYHEP